MRAWMLTTSGCMPETIFTASEEHLASLSPEEAVRFFRGLLWAEARRIEIPLSGIHVSHWINVPDGGIDADVAENALGGDNGLIKLGYTGYQIKAGKSFEPWQDSAIKEELFGRNKPATPENLGEAVKACLKKRGTYVLVCTGIDPTAQQIAEAVSHLKKYFEMCGHAAQIEVLGQNTLLAFLGRFPSLSLQLKKLDRAEFQSHDSWSAQNEMRKEFKPGEKQMAFVSSLRNELRRKTESALHLHVRGEPGIGKTKLVLEATRDDDLRPLVIYCESASRFRDSTLINEVLRDDNHFSMIAVIDECDSTDRTYIWNRLADRGRRIKLVTIYNEFEDDSGRTIHLDVPLLDDAHISAIIQSYDVPEDKADRWAVPCSGSPRVAYVIGLNLRNHPEDLLRPPDTVKVWDRFICGGDPPESADVGQRRVVLQHIALFKRFGYGLPVIAEARVIANRIAAADTQITWAKFETIIAKLRRRKVLQGENTLYITPKLLHIKLWVDWWDEHGNMFDLDQFSEGLPEKLIGWFHDMFQYAKESEAASRTVNVLLGPNGPYQKKSRFIDTALGSGLFLALTDADPQSALRCLQKTIGTWSKPELQSFSKGRRNVVWALERIAMWRDLFLGAARLLLSLAEADNENYTNNASGVFAGLFSLGTGKLAPTEAPPEERYPVLEEALRSDSKERRALGLRACDVALETRLSRSVGAEYQGLREVPQPWMPKTYGELYEAYGRAWDFLYRQTANMTDEERKEAARILIHHARDLAAIPSLADLVVDTLTELGKDVSNREELLTAISRLLHYLASELPGSTRQRWEQLKRDLTGSDFSSLLRRYVGMHLLEDEFDENGQRSDQSQRRIGELAKEAFDNPEILMPELSWLMSAAAKNGYLFGYELGKLDSQFSLWPALLVNQREKDQNASVFFLGGYFRALFERDQTRWDAELDALTTDHRMVGWIPELTWRSGLTDAAAQRMLELARAGMIAISHFRMFCLGSAVRDLSEEMFTKWINYLIASPDKDASAIALDMYDFFYLRRAEKRPMPEDLTFRLLTHDSLLQNKHADTMVDYHWSEVARVFVQLHENRSLALAAKVFDQKDAGMLADFGSTAKSVIAEIARQHPKEIWQLITRYLGPPFDSRSYYIITWLQGERRIGEEEPGVMASMPMSDVWSWVDQDKENRAPFIARYVPKSPFRAANQVCPREILARYGDHRAVLSSMTANFYTEGWTGPRSLRYQSKKEDLLQHKKGETNANVIRWIDEYVEALDKEIEIARIEEERRWG